jgi:hypothetical protein
MSTDYRLSDVTPPNPWESIQGPLISQTHTLFPIIHYC